MKLASSRSRLGFLLLFFMPFFSVGQPPYILTAGVDYSLVGVGALSFTGGQILEKNTEPISGYDILRLKHDDVNLFDRGAIYNYSKSARNVSDVLGYGSLAVPLVLLLDKDIRKDWVVVGVMGVEVLMVTSGFTTMTKTTVLRTRPFVYNPDVDYALKRERDARFSFFSGHTAVAASMTFFAAKVYSDYHPDSKWKPMVWIGAATIPAVTGWMRVEGGKHFPTDVIAGYVVGAAIGYFVPVLHHQKKDNKSAVYVEPSYNGLAVRWVF